MKTMNRIILLAAGVLAYGGLASTSRAQVPLPNLVPKVEVSAGVFTSSGGNNDSGWAARASIPLAIPLSSYGVAASAWYLNGKDGSAQALTGEFRKRFGPFSVAYWAVGGGVANADDQGPLKDGAVWTAGIGATLAGLSVEGRALSSFKGGHTDLMALVGYRF